MNLPKRDTTQLWDSLISGNLSKPSKEFSYCPFLTRIVPIDRYNEFREVNKHLVEYTDSLRHVPMRIYLPDNCPVIQELVSFYGDSGKANRVLAGYNTISLLTQITESRSIPTLGEVLEKMIPDLFNSSGLNGRVAVVAHSVDLPLDTPLNWAYENLSYADNFLHVVITRKPQ